MRVALVGLVAIAGCSDSGHPRYEISNGSIAVYMNPGQSQPTTVLLDRETGKSWYLTRTAAGEIVWFSIEEPLGKK